MFRFLKRQPTRVVLEGVEGVFVPHDEEDENDRESEEGEWQTTREGAALWVGVPSKSLSAKAEGSFLSQGSPV